MEIRFRHSIALVENIERSKHFYGSLLGLRILREYDTFVLFEGPFAIHVAGLFYSYINKPYHGQKMGHDNVDFYLTTDDLPSVQKKLREQQVTFIHEIVRHAWGESVIRVYDPDGHIIEIGDAHGEWDKDDNGA
jgi:catechol 2,3-dioxygenase-like lactoylglutathione lyase family enzyme